MFAYMGCSHTQARPWVCVFFWTGWWQMWEQGSLSGSAHVFGVRWTPCHLPGVSVDSMGGAEDRGACAEGSACTCNEVRLALAVRVEVILGSWSCRPLPPQPLGSPSAIAWSATMLIWFLHPPLQFPHGRMGSSPAPSEHVLKVLGFHLDICH